MRILRLLLMRYHRRMERVYLQIISSSRILTIITIITITTITTIIRSVVLLMICQRNKLLSCYKMQLMPRYHKMERKLTLMRMENQYSNCQKRFKYNYSRYCSTGWYSNSSNSSFYFSNSKWLMHNLGWWVHRLLEWMTECNLTKTSVISSLRVSAKLRKDLHILDQVFILFLVISQPVILPFVAKVANILLQSKQDSRLNSVLLSKRSNLLHCWSSTNLIWKCKKLRNLKIFSCKRS